MTAIPTRTTVEAAEALPHPPGRISAQILNTARLEVRWYRPPDPDPQGPHDRDEIYVVVRGSGKFERAGASVPFAPGDLLFVAKGEAHRFADHTPDTAVWVVFGPGA